MSTKRSIQVGGPRISRRDFFRLGGGAAAGLILVSCGTPTTTQSPTSPPAAPTSPPAATAAPPPTSPPAATAAPQAAIKANLSSVKAGYDNPNWAHHAADILAREKGWFKDVGIEEVEDIIFDDSL